MVVAPIRSLSADPFIEKGGYEGCQHGDQADSQNILEMADQGSQAQKKGQDQEEPDQESSALLDDQKARLVELDQDALGDGTCQLSLVLVLDTVLPQRLFDRRVHVGTNFDLFLIAHRHGSALRAQVPKTALFHVKQAPKPVDNPLFGLF